jgi:ubiquinone/menaquinone biosynthesis C-methylase UbiE
LSDLGDELAETRSDATRLKGVLANRSEETFQLWRMEQPDLPYSDIFAHVSAGRRGRVVDVGCGEGDFFEALTLSFEDVIGLDINAAHMPRAAMRAKALKNVAVITADAQNLPLDTASVDTVVFRMALSQIPRADAAIAEASRVLRKSGFISIIDGEKKSNENFRNVVLSHLNGMKAFEIDFERSLPRLFMLRARKI